MTRVFSRLCSVGLMLFLQGRIQAQTITSQPQSITVNNASSATFTVGASGATSYQWYNGTTKLTDGTNGLAVTTGSTNSVLMLEDVNSNQMGSYSVVINNSVTSSPASLTVTNGTVITFTFSGLLTNAPGSNITVQLFDHDKPATVQNFLHYVTSGAYTNMFFDRVAPGAVLQGGDYGAANQTNTTSPLVGWDIQSYVESNEPPFYPSFPSDLENEFGVGPMIHNTFGTLAMAMSGATNSANSAFFFNLVDNSTSGYDLDGQGFAVFGRIMNDSSYTESSNVLGYFNTLTNGVGAVTNEVFSDYGTLLTNPFLNMLPVNYLGTGSPANSNLVFVNFSFPNGAPPTNADTNSPTVSITTPAAPTLVTNGLLQGTASDAVGVAEVICAVTGVAGAGDVYPSGYTNTPTTNYATGGSNWSLGLFPGTYNVSVRSQNGAGYLSAPASNTVSLTGFQLNGEGTVSLYLGTDVVASNLIATNPVGYPLQQGVTYTWVAKPATGYVFETWELNGNVATTTNLYFSYGGDVLTATFVPEKTPKGTKGISFTYPTANEKVPTNNFVLKGKLAGSFGPAQVTCQIYSTNSDTVVVAPITVSATNTWSIPITNLPPDDYKVIAVATNSNYSSVISENFSVTAFKEVAGTYTGLFMNELGGSGPSSCGYLNCAVTTSGTFSLRISFPAYHPITINGKIDTLGKVPEYTLNIPNNKAYLYNMSVALTGGTNELTGYVYSAADSWVSPFICYRAAATLSDQTTPATGKYILGLSTTNSPVTNGYASLSVSVNGTLNVAGALPDGSTFSESTKVSTNGLWPFYAVPSGYKSGGMVIGWATNLASGAVGADLLWYKAAGIGPYYTNGADAYVHVTGTNYLPPAAGTYALILQTSSNSAPITNTVTEPSAGGRLNAGGTSDKLAISLSSSGVLSGHFVGTNSNNALQFKGAYFGPAQGGSGFILDGDDQTGYFLFEPQ